MCKETPSGGKRRTTYFWRDFSDLIISLCVSVSCSWFVFVFYFVWLFLRLSFVQILALVLLLFFYHFEGSFHFWALSWGLVLRPFFTCSCLMSFSPFSCFFWLLSLLVASFFSVLYYIGRRRAPFFCVRLFRVFFFYIFPGPYSTQLFPLLVLFSAVCRAWIHSRFSFFSYGLFFGLLVFSDSVLRNLQGCFFIYLFLFIRLVLRPFYL